MCYACSVCFAVWLTCVASVYTDSALLWQTSSQDIGTLQEIRDSRIESFKHLAEADVCSKCRNIAKAANIQIYRSSRISLFGVKVIQR